MRFLKDTRGMVAVEAALTLPLVIGVILAALTLSWDCTEMALLDWAASSAESVVAAGGSDAAVKSAVATTFQAAVPWVTPNLTLTRTLATDGFSTDVVVSMPLPIWSWMLPASNASAWVGRTP